ncbi:response regulator, partial [Oleiphilus sp. HI0080]
REIFELRQTFNSVMEELLATTFVKERVEGVIDSLGEMLVVYDLQGELVMANTAFASLCFESGTSPEASRENIFPDDFVVPRASNSPTIMKHHNQGDNHIRHVSWMRTLYTDTDDNIIGIVLTGVDLTEVIELQQELSLKNQAIDEAQTPIIIANATEQGFPISYVNRAFEHQTGYTFDEVKDTSCKFLQGENTDPKEVEKISKALRELRPVTTTILNYRKDGSEFYNRLSLTPIRDLDGEVTHFLGLQSDITDQERTQQYLEQARIKAEDSAKLKAEFLASMSHEIRTPMNGILGMLGLLESTTLNKEQDQHVRLAKSSADALLVLINDILDFSKIEAGKLSLEQVGFDIGNLVADIASSVACVAEDKQLEIVLDISDVSDRGIVGDPGRTRQILNNLIGNAIKFTNHGHVLISATTSVNEDGKCICEITIKDTGVGIPKDRVNVIFDAFSQVDASTTRKFGGTGLGLTICKQLAELLDGDITVTSEIGRGSEFTFKFAAELAKSQPKAAEHSEFSEISVAHLDATAPCLESVKRQLGKWGVESSQFCEPDSLLSEIRSKHFDIVLISAGIPALDANEFSAEIREHSCNPAIKLCLLTRLSDLQNGTDLSTMPVDGYFPKPVTPNELRDALLTLSSNRSEADPKQEEPSDIPKNYKGLHALLVEDNPINQVLAVTLLEDLGLDVKVANHGKEAIETLKKDAPYHLVFMDCQMPEMDGYEATRHIRNGECGTSNQNIPIIAMTANAIAGDREKCLDAGMSDYISKPIDTQILEQKVAYWANEAGENREDEASKDKSLSHHPVDIEKTEDTQRETKPTQSKEERSDMSNSNEKAVPTEVWDKAAALERTIGREDLLCRVIDAYLADTPPHVEQLSNAVEDKDMEQISYLAHTIKGASLNISAAQVSKLAQQLETDAKEGRSDRFSSILPQLQQESEQLFLLLREYTALKAS